MRVAQKYDENRLSRLKNALQRGHKIDNVQILGERMHLKEAGRMAKMILRWISV